MTEAHAPLLLVIEDDPAIQRFLRAGLGSQGYRHVESVTAAHHLAIADRRALRTVHADIRGRVGEQSHEQVDTVNLELDVCHGFLW